MKKMSEEKVADYWKIPRIWEGATAYILGGGSSLLKENLELIHNERVIGINNSFMMGDWVDVCWWGDPRWFDWNEKELAEFGGLKVCCCASLMQRQGVKVVRRGKPMGLELRPDFISWNKSSGGSGVDLAVHLGASKVVLLGFDMHYEEKTGNNNWHDLHKVKQHSFDPYPRFMESFAHIRKDAQERGVEMINSTMNSSIPEACIKKKPLEEVIGWKNLK